MRERESLLLLTLNEPIVGSVVNLDGRRYRIAKVLRWTGTVARLVIEPVKERMASYYLIVCRDCRERWGEGSSCDNCQAVDADVMIEVAPMAEVKRLREERDQIEALGKAGEGLADIARTLLADGELGPAGKAYLDRWNEACKLTHFVPIGPRNSPTADPGES